MTTKSPFSRWNFISVESFRQGVFVPLDTPQTPWHIQITSPTERATDQKAARASYRAGSVINEHRKKFERHIRFSSKAINKLQTGEKFVMLVVLRSVSTQVD